MYTKTRSVFYETETVIQHSHFSSTAYIITCLFAQVIHHVLHSKP